MKADGCVNLVHFAVKPYRRHIERQHWLSGVMHILLYIINLYEIYYSITKARSIVISVNFTEHLFFV
jgi:hypothetical protein